MVSILHRVVLLAGFGLLAGCSLAFGDSLDEVQCNSPADCNASGPIYQYSCIENVCKEVACAPLADCGGPGSGLACSEGRCVDATCSQDDQCGTGRRCGYDNRCYSKWGCLVPDADWPSPPNTPFTFKTRLQKFDSQPLGPVEGVACIAEDPECRDALVGPNDVTVDANGNLEVLFRRVSGAVPFTGVIRVAPLTPGSFIETYFHITGQTPLADDYVNPVDASLLSEGILATYRSQFNVEVNPMDPLTALTIHDCGGRPADGVTVELMPVAGVTRASPFFPVGAGNASIGMPMEGQLLPTRERGLGFMPTLPATLVTLKLADSVLGTDLGILQFTPRAKVFNSVIYYPRYSAVEAWMKYYRLQQADGGVPAQ